MSTDNRGQAPGPAAQREQALARRLSASEEALRERELELAVQRTALIDLQSAEFAFGQRLRARAARNLNRVWDAERRAGSLTQRLRQRLRDAHLPLSWTVRHPLRFARGVLRLRHRGFRLQVAALAESRLFDADHYRAVAELAPTANVVARFLLHGDAAGESPHRLFDPAWYRQHNADLAPAEPPLQHYVRRGGWELRSPHPLFDPRHYLAQFPDGSVQAATPLTHFLGMAPLAAVSPHPLFDPRHYLAQDPDPAGADGNMLLHYLVTGASEQLDPHPLFSSRYYLEANPDLQGRNPLDHFVRQGAAEGRSPHPLFDVPFYWSQRPEVRRSGGNALLDYLARALDDDLDPHPLFDSSFYLAQAPVVRTLGLNPLVHFLQWGARNGLRPNPWFDPAWYLAENPDVIDVNPLQHFVEIGWKEGRDPSPEFSLADYLSAHPEVAAAAENPLEHHARQGRAGGAGTTSPPAPRRAGAASARAPSGDATGRELVPTLMATVGRQTEFRLWMDARAASPAAIEASVRSLCGQLYPRWRLDVWTRPEATDTTRGDSAEGKVRYRPIPEPEPRGVADALLNGDDDTFVGWLTPGDVLEPHALLLAANAAEGRHQIDLIYADEAAATPVGDDVTFKPDFDPLLLASVDYLGSCAFVRAPLVRASGAAEPDHLFRDGRHQWLRRTLHGLDPGRTAHLPYLLVSTAAGSTYTARAGAPRPTDLPALADTYGAAASSLSSAPLVSVIIPTRDGVELLSTCVESVLGVTAYRRFEVVVVDNGSSDPACLAYLARLGQDERCRVLQSPGPFNYSRLNNLGVAEARGELICLLNNDIEITAPDWLESMVAFATRPSVGAVGATLLYPDGTIQHGGVIVGAREVAAHAFVGKRIDESTYMQLARYPREVSAVTGACMVVARERYLEAGGLDEQDLQVNFSDVDLCLKLRARGYRNVILPLSGIMHHESASRGDAVRSRASKEQLDREALVMKQRWGATLRRDPYYSEHLTLNGELYTPAVRVPTDAPARAQRRGVEPYTSLGREPRLDVYAGVSNAMRAAEATRPRASRPRLQDVPPGLSVLILNRNAPELVIPLVRRLATQHAAFAGQGLGFEVVIGDTGSTDPEVLTLYADLPPGVAVVRGMRYNFSRCNNALEEVASFDTVLFLNNDVIFPEGSDAVLRAYRTLTTTPGLGILGSVLFYPDGTLQHMGCRLLDTPNAWGLPYHVDTRRRIAPASLPPLASYPGVTGAFLMIRRQLFREIGGFDPLYAAECQDIALCLEAYRLGFATACAHLGPIVHIENATRPKGDENWGDRRRFLRKYGALIRSLPA